MRQAVRSACVGKAANPDPDRTRTSDATRSPGSTVFTRKDSPMFRRVLDWLKRLAHSGSDERGMSYEDQVARHETPPWWRRRRRRGMPVG